MNATSKTRSIASLLEDLRNLRDEVSDWNPIDAAITDAIRECVPLLVISEDGAIMYASRRVEELFGYGPRELWGRSIHDLVPERVRELHREHFARFVAAPRTRKMGELNMEIMGLRADGTEISIDVGLHEPKFTLIVATVLPRITNGEV